MTAGSAAWRSRALHLEENVHAQPVMSRTSTLVSVVVPTYNRAGWLERTIASALAQTHKALEVLVLDDASDDDTERRVAAIEDDRIRYVRHPQRLGLVRNHEYGFERAASDFVVVLADDDALLPAFVENRLTRLEAYREAIVSFSGYQIVDETLAPTRLFQPRHPPVGRVLTKDELLRAALSRDWSINSSMYRRSAILRVWPRVRNAGHGFDFAMHLHLALEGTESGLYDSWCDVLYTHHRGQASRGDAELAHYAAVVRVYEDVLARSMPRSSRMAIRRDFAAWLVGWGRALAAQHRLREARSRFQRAIFTDPMRRGGWTQLALSWLDPRRLQRDA